MTRRDLLLFFVLPALVVLALLVWLLATTGEPLYVHTEIGVVRCSR